jgi:hypothetical protein
VRRGEGWDTVGKGGATGQNETYASLKNR